VYRSISTTTQVYFENAIGRLVVHPPHQHITIAYYQGPRAAADLQAFLIQAGNLLTYLGWDKLLATQVAMPDFTSEEIKQVCAYWRTTRPQHPALLQGVLLLPHEVFISLSHVTKCVASE
jgi:hypothetical protein